MSPSSSLWVAKTKTPEERAAELEALCRHVERTERLELLATCLSCLGFAAAGALLVGWSFASTDPTWAPIAFWSGVGLTYGGVLLTLAEALRRHGERGG